MTTEEIKAGAESSQWVYVADPDALDAALKCARGVYQRNVLNGIEALSGSTLRGAAREYAGRYAASRATLLERMSRAGILWCELRCKNGRRVLIIGAAF